MKPIYLLRIGDTIVVDGKRIRVRRIIAVTGTHVIVEHLDGKVEAIPIERIGSGRSGTPVAL